MTTGKANQLAVRRAEVSKGLLGRKSYRQMGAELGVSAGTIKKDVEYLRTVWQEEYGQADQAFERSLQDTDRLIAVVSEVMETATGQDLLAAVDRLTKLQDQRNKLLALYPRPSASDLNEIPTGPILLRLEVVEAGNKQLVTQELDDPDIIEGTAVETTHADD